MMIVTNSDLLGKNIRFLREKHGMSRKVLAELVHWDDSLLGELELDISREIDSSVLVEISEVFHRSMDDLLKESCK